MSASAAPTLIRMTVLLETSITPPFWVSLYRYSTRSKNALSDNAESIDFLKIMLAFVLRFHHLWCTLGCERALSLVKMLIREGRRKNDRIPENAGFLCRYGMYLCRDKLVLNQREPLDTSACRIVDRRDLAVQLPDGAAGLVVLI